MQGKLVIVKRCLLYNLGTRNLINLIVAATWLIPTLAMAEGSLFDAYGGYKGITAKATGFFRLEKIDGRHFLITPEGNGYRALGINHFHMMKTTDYDGVIKKIRHWGFNAGCYQGPKWMWQRYPYTQGITLVDISPFFSEKRSRFEDVFDQSYLRRIEAKIEQIVAPQANNKMLIGYFWTDIPKWIKDRYGKNWISLFKSLPPTSPSKKVWEE